jgi:hypothetical protein
MKLGQWQNGRQHGCEYKKFPLWYFKIWKFGFDCYILKYNSNQTLPGHKDPIKDGKHWRLNVGYGVSNFVCEKLIFGKKLGKFTIFLFRPDLYEHSLHVFEKTTKLSFGFAKYQ